VNAIELDTPHARSQRNGNRAPKDTAMYGFPLYNTCGFAQVVSFRLPALQLRLEKYNQEIMANVVVPFENLLSIETQNVETEKQTGRYP